MEIETWQITLYLRCGRETWVGESFWPSQRQGADLQAFAMQVTSEAFSTALPLIDKSKKWKIKVTGERHLLKGPLAEKMQQHLLEVRQKLRPPFTWTPSNEQVYTTTEN